MYNKLVSVEPLPGILNRDQRYAYFQCERIRETRIPTSFGFEWDRRRCGRDATYVVTQIGGLTGREFSIHVCEEHAKPYLE